MAFQTRDIGLLVVAFFLPPLAVFIARDSCDSSVLLNILLTREQAGAYGVATCGKLDTGALPLLCCFPPALRHRPPPPSSLAVSTDALLPAPCASPPALQS